MSRAGLKAEIVARLNTTPLARLSLQRLKTTADRILTESDLRKRYTTGQFVHQQAPVRLWRSVSLLDTLPQPSQSQATPLVRFLSQRYMEDVQRLSQEAPKPVDESSEQAFVQAVQQVLERHKTNMAWMETSFKEWQQQLSNDQQQSAPETRQFLDSFYSLQAGTRLLLSHYVALTSQQKSLVNWVDPYQIAQRAAADATKACREFYGAKQELPEIRFRIIQKQNAPSVLFVEEHLHRILFETFKASVRSVVEHHRPMGGISRTPPPPPPQPTPTLWQRWFGTSNTPAASIVPTSPLHPHQQPPIRVSIVQGKEDVTIRISEESGGVPLHKVPLLWSYLHRTSLSSTTPAPPSMTLSGRKDYHDVPLHETSHGLPALSLIHI